MESGVWTDGRTRSRECAQKLQPTRNNLQNDYGYHTMMQAQYLEIAPVNIEKAPSKPRTTQT